LQANEGDKNYNNYKRKKIKNYLDQTHLNIIMYLIVVD